MAEPELDGPRLDADVAIVGLGGIGSATAFFAARGGRRVIGLERFELGGHARGASHDHSRIIRRSYHTEHYVRLTAAAYDAWREVELASGERCVWITGGVDLFPPGAAIDASTYTAAMDAAGVAFDGAWTAPRCATAGRPSRWTTTSWRSTRPRPGWCRPTGRCRSCSDWPRRTGPTCAAGVAVRELRPAPGGVELLVDGLDRPLRAASVVLAADAWTNELLDGLGAHLPLTVLQEQVSYYQVDDAAPFAMGRFPVWIWMDEPSFYGFPSFGRDGVKIAQDCGGGEVTADDRSDEPDPAILARTDAFGRACFGGRLGPVAHTATCLYTLTPDRDFVLDRVPGHPSVLVAQGAAHGFKFAAWFGRTLAAMAAGGPPADDLAPFAIDRPALREPTGATSWLV